MCGGCAAGVRQASKQRTKVRTCTYVSSASQTYSVLGGKTPFGLGLGLVCEFSQSDVQRVRWEDSIMRVEHDGRMGPMLVIRHALEAHLSK